MKNNKAIISAILVLLILIFFISVKEILFPFIVAFIFSYLLDPATDKLEEKFKISRSTATSFIMLFFILAITLVVIFILPIIITELNSLIFKLPIYIENFKEQLQIKQWLEKIESNNIDIHKKIFNYDSVTIIKKVASHIWQSSLDIINMLSLIFITPVIMFYLLRDWDKKSQKIHDIIPSKYQSTYQEHINLINQKLSGYIIGQFTVCMILAITYGSLLKIYGLNFGFIIGFITGILSFIPYVGMLIGFAIAIIVAIFQYGINGYNDILMVISIFISGQILESTILSPKLIGDKIGLHPIWIIFSMMAGASLFGFYGILFAIPVSAIISIEISFIIKYLKKT